MGIPEGTVGFTIRETQWVDVFEAGCHQGNIAPAWSSRQNSLTIIKGIISQNLLQYMCFRHEHDKVLMGSSKSDFSRERKKVVIE